MLRIATSPVFTGEDERCRSRDAPAPESCETTAKRIATNEKEGGGAPTSASPTGRIERMRQRVQRRTRSPLGAPPRLLLRRPNATTQLRAALPGSPDANGLEALSGASAASTSQTGHDAGPDDARSRPGADRNSARGHRTRSVFREYLRKSSLGERDSQFVTEIVTRVKHRLRSSDRAALGVSDGERAAKALKGIDGKRLTYRIPHKITAA